MIAILIGVLAIINIIDGSITGDKDTIIIGLLFAIIAQQAFMSTRKDNHNETR